MSNKKEKAYDRLKDLYFNFNWTEENATLKFIVEMGAILSVTEVEIKNETNK